MLRTGGRGPHAVSGKASNTCLESHLPRPSNPTSQPFRLHSEMASEAPEALRMLPFVVGVTPAEADKVDVPVSEQVKPADAALLRRR